ncbi:MAG TPA: hypothetical protein VNN72_26585 [Polyangiaceae bacterium]|nr:hypothetical protein [Polyangiaceae bacterium]
MASGGDQSGVGGRAGQIANAGGTARGGTSNAGIGGVGNVVPVTGGSAGVAGDAAGGGASGDSAGAGGSTESTCDLDAFWHVITVIAVGAGHCEVQDPPASGGAVNGRHASVVLDHEGRIVENTGLTADEEQLWLEHIVRDQRWPCLADQTIGYQCTPSGR